MLGARHDFAQELQRRRILVQRDLETPSLQQAAQHSTLAASHVATSDVLEHATGGLLVSAGVDVWQEYLHESAGADIENEAAKRVYLVLRQVDRDPVERRVHDSLDILLEELDSFGFGDAVGEVLSLEDQ